MSEASPTLGCSIEILRDIYMYVCMYVCMYVFDCLCENNTTKSYAKMRGRNYVVQTCACSKSSFGILKRSADYNFRLEFLILPSSGRLKPTCDTHSFILYGRAALAWSKEKPKKQQQRSLRNEKLKANRASVTEEQRRERLRIRREKDRAKKKNKKNNYKRKKKRSSVTEDNENQRQATLKRLKRGDENELERNIPVSVYGVPLTVYRVPVSVYHVPVSVYHVPVSVYCVPVSREGGR